MLKRGGYAKDFSHRFGFVPSLPRRQPGVNRIWIQAVSVGETEAVAPLLRELKKRGDTEVILTTTTSTAYQIIREKYADLVTAFACFPIDFWPFSRMAWKRFDPSLAVLMEGELWPEHLTQARIHKVPMLLINARISDRSFRRYQKIPAFAGWVLKHLDFICAGTDNDFMRFTALGAPAEKIKQTGNMKFDVASGDSFSDEDRDTLYREIFNSDKISKVLLGSSTWPGEEAVLLDAFATARAKIPDLKLLVVPRHAERRAEISAILEKTAWKWYLRSETEPKNVPADADICVADTTGELRRLTHLACLAFVGKSLPPNKGGQTPIECAAVGVPIVYGPEMSNFKDICRSLEDAGAAVKAQNGTEVSEKLNELIEDDATCKRMSAAGKNWHHGNQGATGRILSLVENYIGAGV